MNSATNRHSGFSLVELMVALVLSSLLVLGVTSFFVSQTGTVESISNEDNTLVESGSSFESLSRLLRHAIASTIDIQGVQLNNAPEVDNDSITVDFAVPQGFAIWPNNKPPYDKNWIRITWTNSGGATTPYTILIANASSKGGLTTAKLFPLSGSDASIEDTRIANVDLWPLTNNGTVQNNATAPAQGGYLLRITSRTGKPSPTYLNPEFEPDHPLARYRTYTVSGIIAPRN